MIHRSSSVQPCSGKFLVWWKGHAQLVGGGPRCPGWTSPGYGQVTKQPISRPTCNILSASIQRAKRCSFISFKSSPELKKLCLWLQVASAWLLGFLEKMIYELMGPKHQPGFFFCQPCPQLPVEDCLQPSDMSLKINIKDWIILPMGLTKGSELQEPSSIYLMANHLLMPLSNICSCLALAQLIVTWPRTAF